MVKPTVRFPEFKDSWNNYKIEDIFDKVGVAVNLDDTRTYCEIGIRSHGKGIFHKEETTATEIGNKRVFWVEPGCFVVNIVFAWERAVAKTTEKENGMIASHRFPMYKPKEDIVDLDYITEYFVTKRGQNVLILASPGGAGRNKTLGQKEFAKSVVKLPSLLEQQKIAEFLSTIDTVIEKQKETISAWEERKKGVMQKLFSQEVRFKADDGNEFSEWKEKKLDDVANVIMGQSPDGDSVNLNDGLYLIQGKADLLGSNIVPERLTNKPTKICEPLDLVMTVRAPVGYVMRIEFKACIGRGVCAIRAKKINSNYLLHYMTFKESEWKKIEQGSTFTAVNSDDVKMLKVLVPCLTEQQKIADCLSSLDKVIEKQKATLATWEELKKGLLQQMFV